MIEVTSMENRGVGANRMRRDRTMSEGGFASTTQLDNEPQEAFHEQLLGNDFPVLPPSRSWLKRSGLWAIFAILICSALGSLYFRRPLSTPQVNCETANATRPPI